MAPSKGPDGQPHDLNCLTISELEALAHERMDKQTRDYYNEGADSGSTLHENMTAYNKYRIRPRVLRNISEINTTINIFGHKNSVPFGVAPTAMQKLAHSDGEVGTAKACANAGIVMGLSSFSTSTLEEVKQASGTNPTCLQLYLFEEREHSVKLLIRAKKAGYKAVMLTVDTPMLGRRNLEIRNQFKLPAHLKIANFVGNQDGESEVEDAVKGPPHSSPSPSPSTSSTSTSTSSAKPNPTPSIAGYHDGSQRIPPSGPITFHTHAANPTLTWEESIPWLKKAAHPMQVWVKGITTSEDALLALHHNVDGIIVSNHGGRQLNGSLATLDALPEVVSAIQGKIPIHIDGGIRHGTDVFKALALGADFCWIGRPVLWGLAYNGSKGVEHCLRLLGDEVRLCMGLAGVTCVEEITKDFLVKVDRAGFVSRL